MQAYLISLMQ
jgi:hypothetical protein